MSERRGNFIPPPADEKNITTVETIKPEKTTEKQNEERSVDMKEIDRLIQANDWKKADLIIGNLDQYPELNHKELILKLLGPDALNFAMIVSRHFNKFKDLDSEVALRCIQRIDPHFVAINLDKFKNLDRTVAMILSARGTRNGLEDVVAVIDNLEKFPGLTPEDYKVIWRRTHDLNDSIVYKFFDKCPALDKKNYEEMVSDLIEWQREWIIFKHLDKFKDLDLEKVIMQAIDASTEDSAHEMGRLIENLDKFSEVNPKAVAFKLMDKDWGYQFTANLDKFPEEIHKEILYYALKMEDSSPAAEYMGPVLEYLGNFKGLEREDYKQIIYYLFKKGKYGVIGDILDECQGLTQQDFEEIAEELIFARQADVINDYLAKFPVLNAEIAEKMLETGNGKSIPEYLEKFPGLDHQKLADDLVVQRQGVFLLPHLDKFKNVDRRKIAFDLIKFGQALTTVLNMEMFPEIDSNEIAKAVIDAGSGTDIINNLKFFPNLTQDLVMELINRGLGSYIPVNMDQFPNLDHKEIVMALIDAGKINQVSVNLEKFKQLDDEVALRMIEMRHGSMVAENLNKFAGVDSLDIVSRWLDNQDGRKFIMQYFERFHNLDSKKIVLKMIEKDEMLMLYKYLGNFENLDKEVAMALINKAGARTVIEQLHIFHGLDSEIVDKLIEFQRGDYVISVAVMLDRPCFTGLTDEDYKKFAYKIMEYTDGRAAAYYLEKFKGLDAADYQALADKLIKLGNGESLADNFEKFKGLDPKEFASKLIAIDGGKYLLANLAEFPGVDHNEIAKLMIDTSQKSGLVKYLSNLRGLKKELADILLETSGTSVADNLDSFEELDYPAVAEKLFERGAGGWVAKNLEKFKGVDHQQVVDRLLSSPLTFGDVVQNLNKFKGLNYEDVLEKVYDPRRLFLAEQVLPKCKNLDFDWALKIANAGGLEYVVQNVDSFKPEVHKQILFLTMERNIAELYNINFSKFKNLDTEAAVKMFNYRLGWMVAKYLDNFNGLDHKDIAGRLMDSGYGNYLAKYLDKFSGLNHKEIALLLINKGKTGDLIDSLDSFKNLDMEVVEKLIDRQEILSAAKVNETISKSDRILMVAYEMAGSGLNLTIYKKIHLLFRGEADESLLKEWGIKNNGEAGLRELRQAINNLKARVLNDDFDPSAYADNELFATQLMGYVRYTDSEWGRHSTAGFVDTVHTYAGKKKEGKLKEMNPSFKESGPVRISKVDGKAQEEFVYSEQFQARYATIVHSIEGAQSLLKEKHPLAELIKSVREKIKLVLAKLEVKMVELPNEKARGFVKKNIDALKAMDLRSVKDFQQNFTTLAGIGGFEDEMRQLIFFMALHRKRGERGWTRNLPQTDNLSFEELSRLINLVDHITNEEVWKNYFTDKKAATAFKNLINIKAFEEEYNRAQNQGIKGKMVMDFVPTRNWLLEFSGHIADACWASNYNSIGEQFPNFSAVIMAQNHGMKHERLAGAGLLIEAKSKDGKPLLIIRGLNPIENVINQLSPQDFLQKFVAYALTLAKDSGAQLAIAIDSHVGGATTNRPALFNVISPLKSMLKQVEIAPNPKTEFNGYNLAGMVYLLDENIPWEQLNKKIKEEEGEDAYDEY